MYVHYYIKTVSKYTELKYIWDKREGENNNAILRILDGTQFEETFFFVQLTNMYILTGNSFSPWRFGLLSKYSIFWFSKCFKFLKVLLLLNWQLIILQIIFSLSFTIIRWLLLYYCINFVLFDPLYKLELLRVLTR